MRREAGSILWFFILLPWRKLPAVHITLESSGSRRLYDRRRSLFPTGVSSCDIGYEKACVSTGLVCAWLINDGSGQNCELRADGCAFLYESGDALFNLASVCWVLVIGKVIEVFSVRFATFVYDYTAEQVLCQYLILPGCCAFRSW